MLPDERDLGVRPEFAELIVPLADKLDAEKALISKSIAHLLERALLELRRGDHTAAADAYDEIARTWRTFHFPGDAEIFERRASDCRAAARLKKRNAKKGKGRR